MRRAEGRTIELRGKSTTRSHDVQNYRKAVRMCRNTPLRIHNNDRRTSVKMKIIPQIPSMHNCPISPSPDHFGDKFLRTFSLSFRPTSQSALNTTSQAFMRKHFINRPRFGKCADRRE